MGLKLFVHAIRLVLNNLGDAMRISGLLYFAPAAIALLVLWTVPASDVWLPSIFVAVVTVVCLLWIAVAWHRYVLLDERPTGPLPAWDGRRILAYFGYSVLLFLIAIPILFAGALVAGVFAVGGPILVIAAGMIVVFVVLVIGYRLALVLPASSVDKPLRFGEAWEATRGATGNIVVLALVSAIASVVIDLPAVLLNGPLPLLALVWRAAVGWLSLLVGIGILTTLYGHYVERRPIPD